MKDFSLFKLCILYYSVIVMTYTLFCRAKISREQLILSRVVSSLSFTGLIILREITHI
uniref:Uncharacterized protein n=1 Tax=Rhizophora mucronata TaxID=61149 RepID=A0A2P2PZI1_RHIMU